MFRFCHTIFIKFSPRETRTFLHRTFSFSPIICGFSWCLEGRGFVPAAEAYLRGASRRVRLLFGKRPQNHFHPARPHSIVLTHARKGSPTRQACHEFCRRARIRSAPRFERQPGWPTWRWMGNTIGLRTGLAIKPSGRGRCSESGRWPHRPVRCGKPDRLTRFAAFVLGKGVWDGSEQ